MSERVDFISFAAGQAGVSPFITPGGGGSLEEVGDPVQQEEQQWIAAAVQTANASFQAVRDLFDYKRLTGLGGPGSRPYHVGLYVAVF